MRFESFFVVALVCAAVVVSLVVTVTGVAVVRAVLE